MFYDNPKLFIKENLGSTLHYPDYIIVFAPMKELIESELSNYVLHKQYFNSYFHWDTRRSGDLIIFRKQSESQIE